MPMFLMTKLTYLGFPYNYLFLIVALWLKVSFAIVKSYSKRWRARRNGRTHQINNDLYSHEGKLVYRASCYEGEAKEGGSQGGLASENVLVPSGMPETHHIWGQFSCGALCHTVHDHALNGLQSITIVCWICEV